MHVYVYVYAGICGICTNICTLECPLHIHPELRMGYMRISQGVYPDASAERLKLKLRTELVLRTECVLRPEEGSQLTTARNLGPTHPETFRIPFVNLSRSYPGSDDVVPSTWIPDRESWSNLRNRRSGTEPGLQPLCVSEATLQTSSVALPTASMYEGVCCLQAVNCMSCVLI